MGNKLNTLAQRDDLLNRKSKSITWHFRYMSKKKVHPTMIVQDPYLNISNWLNCLNLQRYKANFEPFSNVNNLLELSELEIEKLGVKNSMHRRKMLSSLVAVREQVLQQKEDRCASLASQSTNAESKGCKEESHLENFKSVYNNKHRNNGIKVMNSHNKNTTFDRSNSATIEEDYSMYQSSNIALKKQSKSCGDICDMAAPSPSNDSQEAIALKKALEWELTLDSRDLRSHAWYHGTLPRQKAEEIVQKEGDFLIRDCVSQPDNFVLTCHTKNTVLHFVINKILLQAETVYERVQYQFEDDAYDTLADLITFYVGSGKPISAASAARIQFPCNRTYPLSFYGNNISGSCMSFQTISSTGAGTPLHSSSLANSTIRFNMYNQPSNCNNAHSPMSSPPRTKRDTAPRLHSKKQRSHSLTPLQAAISSMPGVERYSSADGVIGNADLNSCEGIHNGFQTIARSTITEMTEHLKFTTHSLPRHQQSQLRLPSTRASSVNRDISELQLSPCIEAKLIAEIADKPPSPPPKPARAPNLPIKKDKDIKTQLPNDQHIMHRVGSYHASGSDSGNGSGDSVQSSAPSDATEVNQNRGVLIKNPRFMTTSSSTITLKSFVDFDVVAVEKKLLAEEIPTNHLCSSFDVENFNTLLLPSVDNRPLDGEALNTFKMMLLETGPKIIAEHITRIDINMIFGEIDDSCMAQEKHLQCSGLELLILPTGKIFRDDLIERTQCIRLLVAITVLTCQNDYERAEILSKWIQVAVDTKTALGNLFGFCAIMLGLCMSQIQKLEKAWHILRQRYTDSAFTFEAKLRPTLKAMNDCSNPQAPNTTVPHLLLYILLKDRGIADILDPSAGGGEHRSLVAGCVHSWESMADDFGLSINFLHLDSGRGFLKNINLFKKNSKTVLEDSISRLDELLSDAFRTEFHIKFLWGSNGASAVPTDRHSKMEKILALMADKFCSVDPVETE